VLFSTVVPLHLIRALLIVILPSPQDFPPLKRLFTYGVTTGFTSFVGTVDAYREISPSCFSSQLKVTRMVPFV